MVDALAAPEQTDSRPKKYVTFFSRFLALLIDAMVLLPLTIPSYFILSNARSGSIVVVIWWIFHQNSSAIYRTILHSRVGRTVGKMAMEVQVLDQSEERLPTFWQSLQRELPFLILNLPITILGVVNLWRGSEPSVIWSDPLRTTMLLATRGWFLLEIISVLSTQHQRALHDLIGRTVVVRKRFA